MNRDRQVRHEQAIVSYLVAGAAAGEKALWKALKKHLAGLETPER